MTFTILFITCININSLVIKADNDVENYSVNEEISEIKTINDLSKERIKKVSNVSNTLSESIVYTSLDDSQKTSNFSKTKSVEVEEKKSIKKIEEEKSITTLKSEEFTLTFYTSLAEENSGYEGLNAYGGNLEYGQIASNVYPKGTQIRLEGMGMFEVYDVGGQDFDTGNRIDIFIPRLDGESDAAYKERVLSMGKVKVKGYILN